jgi:hypothetical protein
VGAVVMVMFPPIRFLTTYYLLRTYLYYPSDNFFFLQTTNNGGDGRSRELKHHSGRKIYVGKETDAAQLASKSDEETDPHNLYSRYVLNQRLIKRRKRIMLHAGCGLCCLQLPTS